MVPGHGPKNAKIVFVGEAPGFEEERVGRPFVGASGTLLRSMLHNVGINPDECYFTNIVKTKLGNNDFDMMYLDKQRREPSNMLKDCITSLEKELREINPNVIVPLGSEPLRALAGKRSIDIWRGSILPSTLGGKVIGTYHPAYVLRQYINRVTSELDFKRIAEESKTRELNLPQHRFTIAPSFEQVMDFLRSKHQRLALDIETTGNLVRCLGFSSKVDQAICIPFMASQYRIMPGDKTLVLPSVANASATTNSYWEPGIEYAILQELERLLGDESLEKVAQNFPFDSVILAKNFGLEIRGLYMDTMVAHHCCYAELPKGLGFLASIYTRVPCWFDHDLTDDRSNWLYNCFDNAVTLEASYRLDREMAELGVDEFYHNHVQPSMLAYTRAETRGILIDQDARSQQAAETRVKLEEITLKIRQISGLPELNPNSDKQIKELLYGKLALKPILHHKTKQPTSDVHARLKLRNAYPQYGELFLLLDDHSERSTLLSSFLEKPLGPDGRIRTHYNTAGTVTGRLASSEPLFDVGTNLQNIPVRTEEGRRLRRAFISDSGWSLIKTDLASAEFRIVVWLAKIDRIIQRYTEDPTWDVHRWFAGQAFNVLEPAVTKEQRGIAKNGVYGGNYGMAPPRASQVYKMPLATAKYILDRYKQVLPEIPQWWKSVQSEVTSTRSIRSPLGRLRYFFDRLDDNLYRQAYSHSAQNIVGDVISRGWTFMDWSFDPTEAYPLLQVHDEIVCHVVDGRVDHYAPRIKKLMEFPIIFPDIQQPLIIPAEVSVGKNWYDQRKIEL